MTQNLFSEGLTPGSLSADKGARYAPTLPSWCVRSPDTDRIIR